MIPSTVHVCAHTYMGTHMHPNKTPCTGRNWLHLWKYSIYWMSWQRADKWPPSSKSWSIPKKCGENRSWVHGHTSQMQMVIGNLSWELGMTGRHAGDATGNKECYPWPAGAVVGSRENCVSILCYRGTKGALKRAKYCWMRQSLRVMMGMLTREQPKIKDGGTGRKL